MASINELRSKFDGMSLAQKKQFITNLKSQLQNSNNAANKQFLNECIQKYNSETQGSPQSLAVNNAAQPYENQAPGKGSTKNKSKTKAWVLTIIGGAIALYALLLLVNNFSIDVLEGDHGTSRQSFLFRALLISAVALAAGIIMLRKGIKLIKKPAAHLTNCTLCGREVSSESKFCPGCGHAVAG